MIRIVLACLLITGIAFPVCASNAQLDSASLYFEQGEYQKALAIWEQAAITYPVAPLFFNSGLAYQALGNRVDAIYRFEQALRLQPWNGRIRRAVDTSRESLHDAVIPVNSFFLQTWYQYLLAFLRPGQWALLGLGCVMVVLIHVLGKHHLFRIKPFLRGRFSLYSLILGVCLLLLAVLSYHRLAERHEALLQEDCTLYQGATSDSPELRKLEAGEKVTITDAIGSWKYVTLPNLDRGWLQEPCIRIISIPGY